MKKTTIFFLFLFVLLIKLHANPDSVVITTETFGTQEWELTAGNPNTYYDYEITSLTSDNGVFNSGYSIRINSFADNDAPDPGSDYPDWSGSMSLLMAPASRYEGRWDTIVMSDIAITGYTDLGVSLGYMKRNNTPGDNTNSGFSVNVSIDGGSWIELDTNVINHPLAPLVWQYIRMDIPGDPTGDVMNIMLVCGNLNQHYIDDLTLSGVAPVSAIRNNRNAEFQIYPNPVSNQLTIENASTIMSVEIIGLNGSWISSLNRNNSQILIDTRELESGMYFLRITTSDGNVYVNKLIKK